jgi:hypothetical protein
MAERPVFIPKSEGAVLVQTERVSFQWFPGMAASQKQKSIAALHSAAVEADLCRRPLEVSSKSAVTTGVALSAFNLGSRTQKSQRAFTVETAFQSSKVFEHGGPYRDLLYATSREAKKDHRLQESGRLMRFDFFGEQWALEPKTAFYDWLYINTLVKNEELVSELVSYDAFTDIEFNPERSINCQAYSLALFKALQLRGLIEEALFSREAFLSIVSSVPISTAHESTHVQPRLV